MFVDIHNHILPGVDDGSDSVNMTREMFNIAREEGITKIIATPHFIYGDVNNTAAYIKSRGTEIKDIAREYGIELKFGSEVFICPEICSLVQDGTICRLDDSRYILIELPMLSIPSYTTEVLYNLQLMGYTPVIAHPERNKAFQSSPDKLAQYVERGILAQVNATSITKLYGKDVQKVAMKLIGMGLVHFVGTDSHTNRGRAPRMEKAYDTVVSEFGRSVAEKLFTLNGQAVLENREISIEVPVKKKKTFFAALFNL